MRKVWFKRKLYGWGWTPATWQGWLVTAIFAGIIFWLGRSFDSESSIRESFMTFFIPLIFLTILFIYIAYRTGEKPFWQWGKRKEVK